MSLSFTKKIQTCFSSEHKSNSLTEDAEHLSYISKTQLFLDQIFLADSTKIILGKNKHFRTTAGSYARFYKEFLPFFLGLSGEKKKNPRFQPSSHFVILSAFIKSKISSFHQF